MRAFNKIAWSQIVGATLVLSSAVPFKPQNDSTVVARLPRSFGQVKAAQMARQSAKSNPTDRTAALVLARKYLQNAQRTSDPVFVNYAEGLLNPFLGTDDLDNELLYLRAVLRQHKHAFEDALSDLNRILAKSPADSSALLTKASILIVQGRYPEARAIFQKHLALTGTCEGMGLFCWLTSLNGSLEASYQLLFRQLPAVRSGSSEECFMQTMLGEMSLRLKESKRAETHFRRALALEPDNSYVLACLSDSWLETGREKEVLRLIEGNTQSEALLLRRAIARKRLNQTTANHEVTAIAELFRQSGHFRELAAFQLRVLRQPGEALKTALCNWEAQKEPADALIALEAAEECGSSENVSAILDWLRESKVEDFRLQSLQARLAKADGTDALVGLRK